MIVEEVGFIGFSDEPDLFAFSELR